jgi:signal transduction histidine kinase
VVSPGTKELHPLGLAGAWPRLTLQRPISPRAALLLASAVSIPLLLLFALMGPRLYVQFSPGGYLVFHNVAELFSVMVALSIFGVGWFTHEQSRDRQALFLACAFLAVGLMDFLHTLSYSGMPAVVTPSSPNKASQLWLAVRFFAAAALAVSAVVPRASSSRWLSRPVLLGGALAIPAAAFVAVTYFGPQLPAAFVPGVGQTAFKRDGELVVIGLLLLAIAGHLRRHAATGEPLIAWLVAGLAVCAYSEIPFAAYRSVTDSLNALGHLFKIAAFWLIYRGLFIASVQAPFREVLAGREALSREMASRALAEEQLRQSQKLEAIGRLAGGVAHDFNNLLTGILGSVEAVIRTLPSADPRRADVVDIESAALRAAALTRQLLAFSRRQVIAPRVLILNEVVAGMERLLRRILGEEIELQASLDQRPLRVLADQGQLEQVILNLAVNARDAMPGGGRLTLATSAVELGAEDAARRPGLRPGPHALLEVRDSGTGMSPEVQSHLFEPYFTTKERGKGTGLGLSTVYGILHQAGGDVQVRSQVGAGTVVRVLLPLCPTAATPDPAATRPRAMRGTETVLVVEDDALVRRHAVRALEGAGYTVLQAADGEEALRGVLAGELRVDLLVSDVTMPRLGGVELAARARDHRPDLRVLYISGHEGERAELDRALRDGTALLAKPFTPSELACRVRELLDGPSGGRRGYSRRR